MTKKAKILLSLISASLLILSACGGMNTKDAAEYETTYATTNAYSDYYYNDGAGAYDYEESDYYYSLKEVPEATREASGETVSSFVRKSDEKLIYTCSINMETLTFNDTVNAIRELIAKYNGFVESEEQTDYSSGWYYSDYRKTSATLVEMIVIRIPTENYDAFITDLSGNGKITNKNQSVQNITTLYNDTATTIQSLKTQEARLLEMMEDAKTIEEMLSIEDRLTEVQTELAIYQNRLQGYDLDVAYSTITLNVREVLEYTPDTEPVKVSTFGDRLKNTLNESWDNFTDFLEELLFFLIRALPILIVIGAIVFGIVFAIIRGAKKGRERRAKKCAASVTIIRGESGEASDNNKAD